MVPPIEYTHVIGVVTKPDQLVGRKQLLTESPVKKVALKNNIKVLQPPKIREDYQTIIDLEPDVIITCAYGQFLPKELLDYPKYGCINVHASLLPKLRGGAPIHKAIIDGYTTTGITIMHMGEKMDNGDIISQIRGLNPWPVAHGILDDQEIKIYVAVIGECTYEQKS